MCCLNPKLQCQLLAWHEYCSSPHTVGNKLPNGEKKKKLAAFHIVAKVRSIVSKRNSILIFIFLSSDLTVMNILSAFYCNLPSSEALEILFFKMLRTFQRRRSAPLWTCVMRSDHKTKIQNTRAVSMNDSNRKYIVVYFAVDSVRLTVHIFV